MTHNQFIALVRQPEKVTADHIQDLKELIESYPYFVPARMLYVKALQQSRSIHFASNAQLATMYCSSRRWLYYFIHPEKMLSNEPYRRERNGKSGGDYFDLMSSVESEGGDTRQTLKTLAERLKSARAMVITEPAQKNGVSKPEKNEEAIKPIIKVNEMLATDYFSVADRDVSESRAKKLISEKKYREAIGILKELNLNNPKKSVYFADQIRFLEKVLDNSKK